MTLIIAAAALLGFAQDGKIDTLIEKLGEEEFADREAATQELRKIGKPAVPALEKALEHKDPEVKMRAKRLLDEIKGVPAPGEKKERGPNAFGRGARGSSVSIQSVNGNATYTIKPGNGDPAITFYKSADGRVQLKYTDDDGNAQEAEAPTIDAFLKDHAALAAKYGITRDGVSYGGARANFNGGAWQGFRFGQRFNFKPEEFNFPKQFKFRRLGPAAPRMGSFAGARFEPVSDALRSHFEIPKGQGLVVKSVTPGKPAHEAGLRKNDVLLEVAGKPVSSVRNLDGLLKSDSTVTVLRKGARRTLTASTEDKK